jgi:hypothetical protein
MATKTKTKPGWLTAAKDALVGATPPDWDARERKLEEAEAYAEREYQQAARDVELSVDGRDRLKRSREALQTARDALADFRAGRDAWDAEQRQRSAADRAEEIARQDKASRAKFAKLAALAKDGEAQLAAYVEWFERFRAQAAVCRDEFGANERLRQDMAFIDVIEPTTRQIAKAAAALGLDGNRLPPGSNVLAATTSDPREWPSLGDHFGDLAKVVLA